LAESQKNKDTQIAELTKQRDQQTQGQQETKQRAEALKGQNEKLLAQVAALQTKHNELAETQKNKDAKIAELSAQRDQQAKDYQETKQQAESLKAQNEKLSADRAQKLTENEQLAAQVTALQNKQNELLENQKNKDARIAELTKQRNDQTTLVQEKLQQTEALTVGYEDKIKQLNEAVIGLQTSLLKAQERINEKLESSNANLLKSTTEHMTKIQKSLNWRMDKGFLNTVKQVESFIGVQSFLETGQLAMEYHGWPISSDVALFLLGKLEKNNYDLIIEFGSGTSTQLFAKAINNQVKGRGRYADEDLALIGRNKDDAYTLTTLPLELPNRIVTFEHNKKYYNKTMTELEGNQLSHLVDLVHAPLIEMKIENEDYLYYSCEHKLAQLAAIYAERSVKILVLIDGPPGDTGPLARLPAMPLLLNYLGKHQLDIVLDDYNRQEEKETVVRWKKQFDKRYLAYEEEIVPCEKGAFFCRINP
jgi:myosin heavy subunit